MSDDGSTKDDVKMPDGEVGEKIEKLFRGDEKDTSEFTSRDPSPLQTLMSFQMSLS